MDQPRFRALGLSQLLLRIARVINVATGAGLVLMFAASFLFEPTFREFFTKQPPRIDPAMLMPTLRLWMILALPMVVVVDRMIDRLLAMVDTVRAGDPFVAENAARMKTIAWYLLVLQLFNLSFGILAKAMNAAGSRIDWTFNGAGWVAVGLVFVLALVFEEGTRMRADLEAMI